MPLIRAARDGLQTGAAQYERVNATPASGELVEVRRLRLLVAEEADPVAQVVDGDEEDVGLVRRRKPGRQ